MRNRPLVTTLAALGITIAGAGAATAADRSPGACFLSRDWSSWKAAPDSKSIYIRVEGGRVFRLDLPQACPALNSGNPHLVTHVRGSAWICSPVDIDLKVADDNGFQTPCIVGGMTPLSPGEVAALPPRQRP